MSKSYGNFISLSESDESIRTKTRAMMTDPARKRRTDPGQSGRLPGLRLAQVIFAARDAGMGGRVSRLPHRGNRLHRMQGGDGRQSDQVDRAGARAPRGIRRASRQQVLDILETVREARARGARRKRWIARPRSGLSIGEKARRREISRRRRIVRCAECTNAKAGRLNDGITLQNSSRNVRRPARSAARSDPQAGDGHPQYPHRQDHRPVSRIPAQARSSWTWTSRPISFTWPRR